MLMRWASRLLLNILGLFWVSPGAQDKPSQTGGRLSKELFVATLKKYDKQLKRDIVVTTNSPSEINQLKHEGFTVQKPKQAAPKSESKTSK